MAEEVKLEPDTEPALRIQTLGGFRVWRDGYEVPSSAWGREKALHLFQFMVTNRQARMHKEQIIDQLWPQVDAETGDRDFKVALNALMNSIEPEREPRAPSRFVLRREGTYQLDRDSTLVDADAFEQAVKDGNAVIARDPARAAERFRLAVDLYRGDYLPERRFVDWSSTERERLQTLALATMTRLAELDLEGNPLESLRLSEMVLKIDPVWESAYRVQMRAHLQMGNRPLAVRAYQQCVAVLAEEFGLEPLPETQALYAEITGTQA